MRHLIYGLGVILAACGLTSLYWSIDLAGIERGTAYASAGASLLGSGVMTIALGRAVQILERLAGGGLLARAAAKPVDAPPAPVPPPLEARPPEPAAPTLGAGGVALAAAQAEAALAQSEADTPARDADDAAPRESETKTTAPAPRRPAAPVAAPAPPPDARVESGPGGVDPFPTLPSAPPPKAASKPDVRIVGRYQANGVDYALFSDGSIEAERGGVRQRFNSLSELKAFIEQA